MQVPIKGSLGLLSALFIHDENCSEVKTEIQDVFQTLVRKVQRHVFHPKWIKPLLIRTGTKTTTLAYTA